MALGSLFLLAHLHRQHVLFTIVFLDLIFGIITACLPPKIWFGGLKYASEKARKVILEKCPKGARMMLIFQGCFGDFWELQSSLLSMRPGRGSMSYLMVIIPFLRFCLFLDSARSPFPMKLAAQITGFQRGQTTVAFSMPLHS